MKIGSEPMTGCNANIGRATVEYLPEIWKEWE